MPWHIDVNEHCAFRQSQVKQCAEKHFPVDKHKKHREYIQEDTWQLILVQKACKRTIKYIARIRQLWQNADIFRIWADSATSRGLQAADSSSGAPKYPLAALYLTIEQYRYRRKVISKKLDSYRASFASNLASSVEAASQTDNQHAIFRSLHFYRCAKPTKRMKQVSSLFRPCSTLTDRMFTPMPRAGEPGSTIMPR